MRARTSLALALAAAAALAIPPATAGAATVTVSASAGPAAGEFIWYRVGRGENNRVRVLIRPTSIVIVDKGTKRITPKRDEGFGRCRSAGLRRVICPNFGLETSLRDGNDRFSVAPGDRGTAPSSTDPFDYEESYEDTEGAIVHTVFVNAGDGDDFVSGSDGDDILMPGRGTDRVEGRDGNDVIYSSPDLRVDRTDGGGGIDALRFFTESNRGVTVDMAAHTANTGTATSPDVLKRIERVHGGQGDDLLAGTEGTDALYGEGGVDTVAGRGGNDLVVGDSPITSEPAANTLTGGDGDDVLDARAPELRRTSNLNCGNGADRMLGASDDFLADASCESAIPRVRFGDFIPNETLLVGSLMRIPPVARDAQGAPTYEVPCPTSAEQANSGCTGTVALEEPPGAGAPASYGSGAFNLAPGQRANVPVTLTDAGKAAIAANQPYVVHVTMDLAPVAPSTLVRQVDFGWQTSPSY
jgi:hypothetical protein